MVGREKDQIFVVDTHLVSLKCDGKDGGVVKLFPDPIRAQDGFR